MELQCRWGQLQCCGWRNDQSPLYKGALQNAGRAKQTKNAGRAEKTE